MFKKLDPVSILIGVMLVFSIIILIEDFYVGLNVRPADTTRFESVSTHKEANSGIYLHILRDKSSNLCWVRAEKQGGFFGPIPCE